MLYFSSITVTVDPSSEDHTHIYITTAISILGGIAAAIIGALALVYNKKGCNSKEQKDVTEEEANSISKEQSEENANEDEDGDGDG